MDKPIPMGVKETGELWRDSYITPQYITSAIKHVFPEGWLDPCPQEWEESHGDGLDIGSFTESASKNVYINPPFSQYQRWTDAWLEHETSNQIWICHTNNSSQWYKDLERASDLICLLNNRVKFIDPRTGLPSESSAIGKSQTVFFKIADTSIPVINSESWKMRQRFIEAFGSQRRFENKKGKFTLGMIWKPCCVHQ